MRAMVSFSIVLLVKQFFDVERKLVLIPAFAQ